MIGTCALDADVNVDALAAMGWDYCPDQGLAGVLDWLGSVQSLGRTCPADVETHDRTIVGAADSG